jgi:[ribosomal protein S5]-alanine N-acetyltransferase
MNPFPTLRTQHLVLREIVHADAPDLFSVHGDSELTRWFGTDPVPHLQAAEQLIETFAAWRQLPNPGTRWGLQLADNPRLIGTCGLFDWNRDWKKCSTGFVLARAMRGKGYMREAMAAVLSWGFEHMALNRVEALVRPLDLASLRLLRTIGFEQEGCLREAGYWDGGFHDLLQFALLRREYRRPDQGDTAAPPEAPHE